MIKVVCFGRKPARYLRERSLSPKVVFTTSDKVLAAHAARLKKEDSLVVLYDAPWTLLSEVADIGAWMAFYKVTIQLHTAFRTKIYVVHQTNHDPCKFAELCGFDLVPRFKSKQPVVTESNCFAQAFFLIHLPEACRLYRNLHRINSKVCPVLDKPEIAFDSESEAFRALTSAVSSASSSRSRVLRNLKRDLKNKSLELQELKKDEELLFLQLHKIQEELESYYLKNKEIESALNQATSYFRRIRRISLRSFRLSNEN